MKKFVGQWHPCRFSYFKPFMHYTIFYSWGRSWCRWHHPLCLWMWVALKLLHDKPAQSKSKTDEFNKQVIHRAVETEVVVYSVTHLNCLIICNHFSTTETFFSNVTRVREKYLLIQTFQPILPLITSLTVKIVFVDGIIKICTCYW